MQTCSRSHSLLKTKTRERNSLGEIMFVPSVEAARITIELLNRYKHQETLRNALDLHGESLTPEYFLEKHFAEVRNITFGRVLCCRAKDINLTVTAIAGIVPESVPTYRDFPYCFFFPCRIFIRERTRTWQLNFFSESPNTGNS